MSEKIKYVQVAVPEKLHREGKIALLHKGKTWQTFLLGKIEVLVNPKKKKKKK